MTHLLWFFLLSTHIASVISETCVGFSDKDLQLQAAVQYTKTEEFHDLFQKIRATNQWQDYRTYIIENFEIDIEQVIINADSEDTLKSLRRKVERKVPLRIKIQLMLAPASFNFPKLNSLCKALDEIPETRTVKCDLCKRNVNVEQLTSGFI